MTGSPRTTQTLPTCCTDLDILAEHLVFPNRMPAEGREFVREIGLDDRTIVELREGAVDMGDGLVKIKHRCQHLGDDGLCGIYERRPAICRTFDCSTRVDCACKGKGRIDDG